MSDYLIHDSTLEDIADAIRSKTGGSALINPENMAEEIDGLAAVTDGIVVKAMDANGYATEIDLYCNNGIVPNNLFRSGNNNNPTITHGFTLLQKINFKTPITTIGNHAFNWLSALTEIDLDFSALTSVGDYAFMGCNLPITVRVSSGASFSSTAFNSSKIVGFYTEASQINNNQCASCSALKTFEAPKATRLGSYSSSILYRCTGLQTVLLGGVGFGVTAWGTGNFSGCTQSDLTVTAYTNGTYVDGLLSNIRNGATNATIIIKASENTTYNGTTYNAGDTILTSEVTS